jgi:quercetin dioxygenase-like cupin family protein
MLLKSQHLAITRQDLFKGQGKVHISNLGGAHDISPFTAVLACELEPQATVGAHLQPHYDELIMVTHGVGTAYINQQDYSLNTGTVLYLKQGSVLAIHNHHTEERLCYWIVKVTQ